MEDGRNVGGHVNAAMKQAEIKRREKETGEEVKQLINNVKAVSIFVLLFNVLT